MYLFLSRLVILWGISTTALALVNIESEKIAELSQGFSGKAEGYFNGQSGNVDKLSVGLGGRLNYRTEQHTTFWVVNAEYGESKGEKNAEQAFTHLRYINSWSEHHAWELFTQLERDQFRRIELRALAGGGWRFEWVAHSKERANIIGLGAFIEHEKTDDGDENTVRLNHYWIFKKRFVETVQIMNTLFIQPAIDEWDDVRIFDQFSLIVPLIEQLNLKINLTVRHDNQPADNVEKTDFIYSTGFLYTF